MKKSILAVAVLFLGMSVAQANGALPEPIVPTPEIQVQELLKKCTMCHGKEFEKAAMGAKVNVKAMTQDEIFRALTGYKAGERNKFNKGMMMKMQMKKLSPADMLGIAQAIGLPDEKTEE